MDCDRSVPILELFIRKSRNAASRNAGNPSVRPGASTPGRRLFSVKRQCHTRIESLTLNFPPHPLDSDKPYDLN